MHLKTRLALSLFIPFTAALSCRAQQVPEFSWKQSLPIRPGDPQIAPIGGTELRALVAFDGKLFAAVGYWMDTGTASPALPGAQVLRLDAPGAQWQVDLEFTGRTPIGLRKYFAISTLDKVRFATDAAGKPLAAPADLLLASAWKRGPGLDVFSRKPGANAWSTTPVPPSPGQPDWPRGTQIRAFALHRDSVTGCDIVFAGATNSTIISGKYDPAHQAIIWDPQPEWQVEGDPAGPKKRVSSFAECNGKLYAAAYDAIYERTDGNSPAWKKVFQTVIHSPAVAATGFRGLTCVHDPSGPGDVLLTGVEDNPSRIYRINPAQPAPDGNCASTQELDVSSFLTNALGVRATYAIVAYNNMAFYPGPAASALSLLIGLEAYTPQAPVTFHRLNPTAFYLVRDSHAHYTLRAISDPALTPQPPLVSVRTLAVSPFPSDPPGTVFAGGFDANSIPVHNTAWLYKGTPAAPAP